MRVLGKNLYSTPTVAIRELVQNAHDSCLRRRLESAEPFAAAILVEPDAGRQVLTIEDRGAGLTKFEIERYLATVGAGYTRKLRKEHQDAGLIGMFGLGFLSAFVISHRVDVYTTSYQEPAMGWLFSSRSGESFTLRPSPPRPVGTRVEVHLTPEFGDLADSDFVQTLLERYVSLLGVPVHLGDFDRPAINATVPPWRLPAGETSELRLRKLRLEFAQRFETVFEPICTLPLTVQSEPGDPPQRAQGLLWIQDGATYGTSDNRNLSVFVRGMLVSSDERELLPGYAGFVGGVIESNELTPTASREDLQHDDAYEQVTLQLRETLIRGLAAVARADPPTWRRILTRHNEALLGASLCDPRLFELLAEDLKVPTSEGDLTLGQVARRGQGKIHLSLGDRGGSEETLFRALGVPVVVGTRYAAHPFALRYAERSGVPLIQLGTREGNDAIFRQESVAPDIQARANALFGGAEVLVVLARFLPVALPLVLLPDREVLLKERLAADDADKRVSSALLGMARLYTAELEARPRARLFLNLDAPVIRALLFAELPQSARAQGAALLWALGQMLSRQSDASSEIDLQKTLARYGDAVLGLLGLPESAP